MQPPNGGASGELRAGFDPECTRLLCLDFRGDCCGSALLFSCCWLDDDLLVFMLGNTEPLEAISLKFDDNMGLEGHILQTVIDDNFRRPALWPEDLQWYGSMVKDFTGG